MATADLPQRPQAPARLASRFEWRRLAIVCALLAISGGGRYVRDWQFASLSRENESPPFALSEFPLQIGTWQAKPGSEQPLEPEIARIAGASDHVIRTYVDSSTGNTADVMIIYGLAAGVWPHTPEICYPASGLAARSEAELVEVPLPGSPGQSATFRRQVFGRGGDQREVYYSFRNAGQWAVDMESRWKSFRYHPGMFKIQVQHPYSGDNGGRAIEALLAKIADAIDHHSPGGG
ncbi:exosortase C-terminal domain/associated protein EpsI [Aquisphaera giovannonii]|nr:exosortase C-terminal domain/associated protein EpsI [Aquisphaera giovannonii]